MIRGFLRFEKWFDWSEHIRRRCPRPPVRLELERLTERILLSASPVGQLAASTPMAAVMDRVDQIIVAVQNEASSVMRTIAQEFAQVQAYLVLQLDHILGINPYLQNLSLNSPTLPSGHGSGSSNATIKPQVAPGGPDAVQDDYYTWSPTVQVDGEYLASLPLNWMLNGTQQGLNGSIPGAHASDVVTFDPGAPKVQNGNAPITWNYSTSFSSMNVGGQMGQGYNGWQRINSGVTVEMTGGGGTSLSMFQNTSSLNVSFTDNSSVFQIDNNAGINAMNLAGTGGQGLFKLNGGISSIAGSPGWIEQIGTHLDVAKGATLYDASYNPLTFTTSNARISIEGKMLLSSRNGGTTTLINSGPGLNESSGEYIDVNGGTLSYLGDANVVNTIEAPIIVDNGGFFDVAASAPGGTRLIVQGSTSSTGNVSVYLVAGTIALSQSATLEADDGYSQGGGTLETTDNSICNLQDGPNADGTAFITGGTVLIDNRANSYGGLNVLGSLQIGAAELAVSIQGYAQQNPKVKGTSDVLSVSQTLYLGQETSSLYVANNGAQQGDFWVVITSPNSISGDFFSKSSNPEAALAYIPNSPEPGKYQILL